MLAPSRAPRSSWVFLPLALLAACGGGGDDPVVQAPPSETVALNEIQALGDPIVDRPGRVTQWLRAFGTGSVSGARLPVTGLESADFSVTQGSDSLPAGDVRSGATLPGRAAVIYLLIDRLPEEAGLDLGQLTQSFLSASQTWTDPGGVHAAVGWFDGSGLLDSPAATSSLPNSAFTADLGELQTWIASAPPSVAAGSDRLGAMATAADRLNEFVESAPELQYAEHVDRFLVVVDGGEALTGTLAPFDLVPILAGIDASVLNLGPEPAAVPGIFNGYVESFLDGADSLADVLSDLASLQAATLDATYRVAFLPNSTPDSGPDSAQLLVEGVADGIPIAFDTAGFGPGAALVDPGALAGSPQAGAFRESELLADGRLRLLVDGPEGSVRILGLDAGGQLDASFGLNGSLELALDPPQALTGDDWTARPAGLATDPEGSRTFVAVQWTAGLDSRIALYEVDALGVVNSTLLPETTESFNDYASGLERDPKGRLLVYGQSGTSSLITRSLFLMRLDGELALDDEFGEGGLFLYAEGAASARHTARDLAIRTPDEFDGSILYGLVGEEKLSTTDLLEARALVLRESGLLAEYGRIGLPGLPEGVAVGSNYIAPGSVIGDATASGVAFDSQNHICFVGTLPHPESSVRIPVAWRVPLLPPFSNPLPGGPANAFAAESGLFGQGAVGLDLGAGPTSEGPFGTGVIVEDLTFGPDETWLLAGSRITPEGFDAVVWRLLPDGALDTSFNGVGYWIENGTLGTDFGESFSAVQVAPTGELLTFGLTASQLPQGDLDDVELLHFRDADPARAFQP